MAAHDLDANMAKLGTPLILLAIIGIAYWYWTGPYQNSANAPSVDDPKKNAEAMELCIEHEDRVEGLSGHAGSTGEDPEEACANNIGLYKMYGEWHRR